MSGKPIQVAFQITAQTAGRLRFTVSSGHALKRMQDFDRALRRKSVSGEFTYSVYADFSARQWTLSTIRRKGQLMTSEDYVRLREEIGKIAATWMIDIMEFQ